MLVDFNEDVQKYTNAKGELYSRVTDIVKEHKQPFDRVAVAEAMAKKNKGTTAQQFLDIWEAKALKGSIRGDLFHERKEQSILGRGVVVYKNQVVYVQNQDILLTQCPDLKLLKDGLYTELVLWDDTWKIAGRLDVGVIYTKPDGRYVDIDDHKTGETIHTTSHQFRHTKNFKMMQYPVNHMMDCHHSHHELQLSIYMFIMERQGYKPGSMQFTHYGHPDPITGIEPAPVVYPLTYRKKEVLAMLTNKRKNEKPNR